MRKKRKRKSPGKREPRLLLRKRRKPLQRSEKH
jgi:hypothetical protein